MTDRERINKAFGLLKGASTGAEWIGDGKDPFATRLLLSWQTITNILDILDIKNVDSSAQKST